MESVEELNYKVKAVKKCCYQGDRENASYKCEAVVTTRTRSGWIQFRKCRELLQKKRFPATMRRVYQQCCMEVKRSV